MRFARFQKKRISTSDSEEMEHVRISQNRIAQSVGGKIGRGRIPEEVNLFGGKGDTLMPENLNFQT